MLSALVPTIGKHKNKINAENDFERISRLVGCSSSTVRRFHGMMQGPESGCMSENLTATATNDFADGPTRKRKHNLTAEELDMLSALVPTKGIHTKKNDCDRIAQVVGCCSQTVKNYHKKFLEMTGSTASSALGASAAGSSAPARACAGGSGGAAGAAPCGWPAPPAQVIFTIVAAHPRLSEAPATHALRSSQRRCQLKITPAEVGSSAAGDF